jgi:hypothetical protein
LNDFWSLKISKISVETILNEINYIIRKQKYIEMTMENPTWSALEYFKTKLSTFEITKEEIEKLSFYLMKPQKKDEIYQQRTKSFEDILKYFPSFMKQSNSNISDIICE